MWNIAATSLCPRSKGKKSVHLLDSLFVLTFPFDEIFNLGFPQSPLGDFLGVEDHATEALVGHGAAVDGDLASDAEGGPLSKIFLLLLVQTTPTGQAISFDRVP